MQESELSLQGKCYQWAYNNHQQLRGVLFHVPNGGKRSIQEAAQLKASGVVSGVCDLFLSLPYRGLHGMYIEMKLPGEKLRPEQILFCQKVGAVGYGTYRIDNFDDFKELIEWYLGMHDMEPTRNKIW